MLSKPTRLSSNSPAPPRPDNRLLAKATPAGLAVYASGGRWQPARHLMFLSSKLVDLAAGRIKRLIVTMPPRHGKSSLVSQYFPAWYLGLYPNRRIMLASYEATFASTWGRRARDTLERFGPELFGVTVSEATSAASEWEVVQIDQDPSTDVPGIIRGGMVTAGSGGAITGRGAHVFVIDDPLKGREDADSEVIREKIKEWYKSVVYTRLESDPEGAIVIVLTRWHEDDLAGWLLKESKINEHDPDVDQWELLQLPALAEENDLLGREPGEALWPERFPADRLRRIFRNIGGYESSALYQGNPQPPEGGIFKRPWFKYFEIVEGTDAFGQPETWYFLPGPNGGRHIPASDCGVFGIMDVATSLDKAADYTVLAVYILTPYLDLLLIDVVRERLEETNQQRLIEQMFSKWGLAVLGLEKEKATLTLIQSMIGRGYPIKPLEPDKNKFTRALASSALYEAGKVYHLRGAPWLSDWEREHVTFPVGTYDDQVDVGSYAARLVAQMEWGSDSETVEHEESLIISPV